MFYSIAACFFFFNVNAREILCFPTNLDTLSTDSENHRLAEEMLSNLKDNSIFLNRNDKRAGRLRIQSFQPRLSKTVADKIDKLLSMHYGFTEEELDFILNYDIKYRLGDELNEE